MKTTALLLAAVVSTTALGFPGAARAQTSTQQSPESAARPKPVASKKVWTNDDISTLRSPADIYLEEQKLKEEQAEKEAKAREAAAREKSSAAEPASTAHPPRLSNPKTVAAADEMIAWEQRDIDSQTEYVEGLRKQLDEAPAEEKPHLQELIDQRVQIIAETKAEQNGLMQQKKELEEKKRDTTKPAQP